MWYLLQLLSYFSHPAILFGDVNSPPESHGTCTVKRCVLSTNFISWEDLSLCSAATSCQENLAQISMVKNNAGENVMFL